MHGKALNRSKHDCTLTFPARQLPPVYAFWSVTISALLLSVALISCGVPHDDRNHADFKIGMKRSELLAQFGKPDQKQTLYKTSDAIWGPIEDFWPQVPKTAKVEIWSYKSTQSSVGSANATSGATELYFVNDSSTVNGIGFAVEGAVYEASPSK